MLKREPAKTRKLSISPMPVIDDEYARRRAIGANMNFKTFLCAVRRLFWGKRHIGGPFNGRPFTGATQDGLVILRYPHEDNIAYYWAMKGTNAIHFCTVDAKNQTPYRA